MTDPTIRASGPYPHRCDGRATAAAAAAASHRGRDGRHERRDVRLYTIVAARLLGPRDVRRLRRPDGPAARGQRALARRCRPPPRAASPPTPSTSRQIERVDPAGRLSRGARARAGRAVPGPDARHQLVLRLDSLATAALVAVAAVPLTLMGGQAGILQGERRWVPLGHGLRRAGVPRLVIGTALIVWRPTEFAALLGVGHRRRAPRSSSAGWRCGTRATRRARRGPLRACTGSAPCRARPSTTPRRCSRSSRSPTSTSWSPATCSTSTRPACTPAA